MLGWVVVEQLEAGVEVAGAVVPDVGPVVVPDPVDAVCPGVVVVCPPVVVVPDDVLEPELVEQVLVSEAVQAVGGGVHVVWLAAEELVALAAVALLCVATGCRAIRSPPPRAASIAAEETAGVWWNDEARVGVAAGGDSVSAGTRIVVSLPAGDEAAGAACWMACWACFGACVATVCCTATAPPAVTTAAARIVATWPTVTVASPDAAVTVPPAPTADAPPALAAVAVPPPAPVPTPNNFASTATGPSAGARAANWRLEARSSFRHSRHPAQSRM